jgi:hypothetical protein
MLVRIRTILQHLVEGQRVTAAGMARTLDVSQRTVARDFDYMMNGLDLPIRYEHSQRTYILAGPLPSIFAVKSGDGILGRKSGRSSSGQGSTGNGSARKNK